MNAWTIAGLNSSWLPGRWPGWFPYDYLEDDRYGSLLITWKMTEMVPLWLPGRWPGWFPYDYLKDDRDGSLMITWKMTEMVPLSLPGRWPGLFPYDYLEDDRGGSLMITWKMTGFPMITWKMTGFPYDYLKDDRDGSLAGWPNVNKNVAATADRTSQGQQQLFHTQHVTCTPAHSILSTYVTSTLTHPACHLNTHLLHNLLSTACGESRT